MTNVYVALHARTHVSLLLAERRTFVEAGATSPAHFTLVRPISLAAEAPCRRSPTTRPQLAFRRSLHETCPA